MCDQQYDLFWWPEPPLVDIMPENSTELGGVVTEQFFAAFQTCCNGKLPKYVARKFASQGQMMRQVGNMTIALPVSYESRVINQDADVFLRVMESSGLAFVSQLPKEPEGNLLTQGAETVWPLLMLILLTCGYAGLVFWLAEFTVKNEHRQIERSFFKGLFDGYWCAFITATTVGYGDKVTGSRFGKFLTVIWLLFGLSLMASFTAAMTQLMSSSYFDMSQPITMRGCPAVGVLNGSLAQQVITEMGLKPYVANTFDDLHNLLENETIEGFALGQYQCSHFINQINEGFIVAMGQSDSISTGIVYHAFCPTCDALNSCMERYLLVRSLDYCRSLEEKLNHRHGSKPSAMGLATQALGSDHTYLGVTAGILAGLLIITWAIDFLIIKYAVNKKKKSKTQNEKEEELQGQNGAAEVLISQ